MVHLCGSVGVCSSSGESWGQYVRKRVKKRQPLKQYIIVARGAAKSMCFVSTSVFPHGRHHNHASDYLLWPPCRWRQAIQPIKTAMIRSKVHCLVFVYGWVHASSSRSKAEKNKLAPTKTWYRNFLTNSLLEVRPMRDDKLQSNAYKDKHRRQWLSGETQPIGAQGLPRTDYINSRCFVGRYCSWLALVTPSVGTPRFLKVT